MHLNTHKKVFAYTMLIHCFTDISQNSYLYISACTSQILCEYSNSCLTYLKFNTLMHARKSTQEFYMNCSVSFINSFLICLIQMVQLSENIISQLMGFYLSAALLLPRLSWLSLISFFKMTSKQHLCVALIIRSPLVYCFTHSTKCAHNDCK